jgi:hypothetical protein
MSPRVTFHPGEMRTAARRFEHASADNHDILEYIQGAPLFDIGAADMANQIVPRLTQVRRHAADRRRALREMANFIRARALLAEIADGTRDARGKVTDGDAKGFLPKGAGEAVGGVQLGIEALARKMEREFLRGGWIDSQGRLRGRRGAPKGTPNSWSKLSKIAKRLPLIGHLDNAAQMLNALFGKGRKGHRIEAAGGTLGSIGGAAMLGTVASIALIGGPPGLVGVAVLGAAVLGATYGGKLGRYVGKSVIVPLWNGTKSVAQGLASLSKHGFQLAKKGLKILGIHL